MEFFYSDVRINKILILDRASWTKLINKYEDNKSLVNLHIVPQPRTFQRDDQPLYLPTYGEATPPLMSN